MLLRWLPGSVGYISTDPAQSMVCAIDIMASKMYYVLGMLLFSLSSKGRIAHARWNNMLEDIEESVNACYVYSV